MAACRRFNPSARAVFLEPRAMVSQAVVELLCGECPLNSSTVPLRREAFVTTTGSPVASRVFHRVPLLTLFKIRGISG
jgi:hypothetical protein